MDQPQSNKIEITLVVRDNHDAYYLLKVIRTGYDVYCIVPRLGAHLSLHESGVSHIQGEGTNVDPERQPPVAVISGSAGIRQGNGFVVASIKNLEGATSICSVIYSSIDKLSEAEYRKFNRNTEGCFVIDTNSLSENHSGLEVGVWAVAKNGQTQFEFNNHDIPEKMLFKDDRSEPEIWVYARPF